MASSDLNDHHKSLLLNYMRFAKFQRGQCLKGISGCFEDAKDLKFPEPTYTVDEIRDALDEISQETSIEIEAELLNSAHTNVLMLQQVFKQAQKWHLDLDADLAELENRELLDKVKSWEESELSHQPSEKPSLSPKKKLAPLNEGGPMQLLKRQIEELEEQNQMLRQRLKTVEGQATQVLKLRDQTLADKSDPKTVDTNPGDTKEIEELTHAVESMKYQMLTESEMNLKSQKELKDDLADTKHNLLEIQHQLSLAEKELEKKFSETGAYKNMKLMLANKNVQIKELRSKLKSLTGNDSD